MNMHEIQLGCRTFRRFKQESVPEDVLRYALENARISASASNKQPLRYYAVSSAEKTAQMQSLVRFAGALPPEIGKPHKDEEPTAFIVICETCAPGTADIDVGIAAHAIVTSLYEKGFGSCIMRNVIRSEIQTLLEIPEEQAVSLVIAIGRPGCTSTLVDMKDDEFKYWVDDDRNYYVPKRRFEDAVKFR